MLLFPLIPQHIISISHFLPYLILALQSATAVEHYRIGGDSAFRLVRSGRLLFVDFLDSCVLIRHFGTERLIVTFAFRNEFG